MYSKLRTLDRTITLVNTQVELPRDAVLDAVILRVDLTVANAGVAPWDSTGLGVLAALQEVRIVSNGNTVHYALNGQDIAILNAYDGNYGAGAVYTQAVTVPDADDVNLQYVLVLNQGDILAVTKDALDLRVVFNTQLAADVTVTAATVNVTLSEDVYLVDEFVQTFGANLEFAAEPKVYALTTNVAANTEMTGVLDLPTGTLQRRGLLLFTGAAPGRVGLIVTTPDRREVFNADYLTIKGMEAFKRSCNGVAPPNAVMLDYAAEVAADGLGLRGWRHTKSDYQLGLRIAAASELRYISMEHVVNPDVVEATNHAIIEGKPSF